MRLLFLLFFLPSVCVAQVKVETTVRVISVGQDGNMIELKPTPVAFVAAPLSERVQVAQVNGRTYAFKTEILKTNVDETVPYIIRCVVYERIDGVTNWRKTNTLTYDSPTILKKDDIVSFEVKDELDSHYSMSSSSDGRQFSLKYDIIFRWVE